MAAAMDSTTLLRQLPLLEGLPDEDVRLLADRTKRTRLRRDGILFLEGEEGDAAYVVVSGQINLVFESLDGSQLLLRSAGSGQFFGEMALLDGKPRTATAVAGRETEVLAIFRKDFLAALQSHPDIVLRLLRTLSDHVRKADETIKLFGFVDVAGRLAHTLLDLDRPPGRRASIRVRHDELAAMIGSSRQTVSTILGTWRDLGYVTTGRAKLILTDREALAEFVES